MPAYNLHIQVKPGHEREAIRTLSAIERRSQGEPGCLSFTWFQHEQDPYRFTLVEQWASQDDLDAHLARDPGIWEEFVPALATQPQSESLRPVRRLSQSTREEICGFVLTWFDRLSNRAAVEELLSMVAADGFTMQFPEATLTNEDEFRKWYAEVGDQFRDQSHTLVALESVPFDAENTIGIDLVVMWKATKIPGGDRLTCRAEQTWRLCQSFTTGEPQILTYQVRSLAEVSS